MQTEAMARRDRTVGMRGKETAIRIWNRMRNRRARVEGRAQARAGVEDHLSSDLDWECTDPCCAPVDPTTGDRYYPRYSWEMGYRDDLDDVLGLATSCNCVVCGRFLPATGDHFGEEFHPAALACHLERGDNVRVRIPVAHVDHDGRPCLGGPSREFKFGGMYRLEGWDLGLGTPAEEHDRVRYADDEGW